MFRLVLKGYPIGSKAKFPWLTPHAADPLGSHCIQFWLLGDFAFGKPAVSGTIKMSSNLFADSELFAADS